jgi:hypothetical protein
MEATGRLGQQIEQKSEEIRSWPIWAQPLPPYASPNEMPPTSANEMEAGGSASVRPLSSSRD